MSWKVEWGCCSVPLRFYIKYPNDRFSIRSTMNLIFSYPKNGISALKTVLWLFGMVFGIVFGKIVIHNWLFCRKLQLKIFTLEGQGSWVVIFLFTCCVLLLQTVVYNTILELLGSQYDGYHCSSNLHIQYKSFMKGAALVTWLGDFFTVWMVLDTVLQV